MNSIRKGEWFEMMIPEDWKGYSIDYIFREIWKGPKKQIHQLRMDKSVLHNGNPVNWNEPLKIGDRLQIKFFAQQEFGIQPSYIDISVIYEDDHLLIVNKPAGMDTHPNAPNQTNTLANAVAFYLQAKGEYRRVQHVHRLDQGTTGAVLFAKHSFVGAILDKMLEERKIKRTYIALIDGILKRKKGTIDEPIGRDRHHATKRRVSPTGQKAITHFTLLKAYHKQNQTLIQCVLDTGRTHQIRVHLSHIGYPISGDTLYEGKSIYSRPALHAAKMEFAHPITGENIVCYAPFIDQPTIFQDSFIDLIE